MYTRCKRRLDIGLALGGLIATSPLWLVVAAAIRLTDGPPVLHRGDRAGMNGRVFQMLKFRTMRRDAHLMGPGITGESDPRVTPLGRFLRRWKLDELPQLVNVLLGDMSMVGPRPEDPRYLADYNSAQMEVLSVQPGVTGPTQLRYRHEDRLLVGTNFEQEYRTKLLPAKLELDLEYIRERSLQTDVGLILATILSLFRR